MTDDESLQAETFAERERLAALLAGLTEQQWAAPSLCAGWRVREVIAHLTMPYRMTGAEQFQAGLAAHGFDFDRYADAEARETTEKCSDADLLGLYRDNVRHPWLPPGGGPAGALSHEVIHGLDVTEALGLPAAPTGRTRCSGIHTDSNPSRSASSATSAQTLGLTAPSCTPNFIPAPSRFSTSKSILDGPLTGS